MCIMLKKNIFCLSNRGQFLLLLLLITRRRNGIGNNKIINPRDLLHNVKYLINLIIIVIFVHYILYCYILRYLLFIRTQVSVHLFYIRPEGQSRCQFINNCRQQHTSRIYSTYYTRYPPLVIFP